MGEIAIVERILLESCEFVASSRVICLSMLKWSLLHKFVLRMYAVQTQSKLSS